MISNIYVEREWTALTERLHCMGSREDEKSSNKRRKREYA